MGLIDAETILAGYEAVCPSWERRYPLPRRGMADVSMDQRTGDDGSKLYDQN
jgi:hypothetical protein